MGDGSWWMVLDPWYLSKGEGSYISLRSIQMSESQATRGSGWIRSSSDESRNTSVVVERTRSMTYGDPWIHSVCSGRGTERLRTWFSIQGPLFGTLRGGTENNRDTVSFEISKDMGSIMTTNVIFHWKSLLNCVYYANLVPERVRVLFRSTRMRRDGNIRNIIVQTETSWDVPFLHLQRVETDTNHVKYRVISVSEVSWTLILRWPEWWNGLKRSRL